MDCETCGWPMKWEGSLRDGGLACGRCESKGEEVPLSQAMREALSGAFTDASKKHIDSGAGQYVEVQCANCGLYSMCISYVDPSSLICPYCSQAHFLRRA